MLDFRKNDRQTVSLVGVVVIYLPDIAVIVISLPLVLNYQGSYMDIRVFLADHCSNSLYYFSPTANTTS